MNLLRRAQGCFLSGCDAAIAPPAPGRGHRLRRDRRADRRRERLPLAVPLSCGRGAHDFADLRRRRSAGDDGGAPAHSVDSDRYTAQQGHADEHQTHLAHLALDIAYVVEVSDDPVPWRLQLWLGGVFALAEHVVDLAASTLSAQRRSLDRQFGAILATPSRYDLTRELQATISRARDQLLVFLAYPGKVGPTDNSSERLFRPAVVQRKVTNGDRAM